MARQAGELWVRRPTETLQYHINGQTKTLFPEPYLTVLDEDIQNGDLVSLVYDPALEMSGVVRTDNTTHEKSLGLARLVDKDPELGEYPPFVKGESYVEVQTLGLFQVPFDHFTQTPVASDVGSPIFAVSPREYGFRRGEDTPGKMTISRTQATTFGGSIIEVGTVSAIDLVEELVTIKVLVGGDSRGPVGLTEVEYISNQIIPTVNTPRVFAYVGYEQSKNHKEVFEWNIPNNNQLGLLNNNWIALDIILSSPDRSGEQKKTVVIYFTNQQSSSARDIIANTIVEEGLRDGTVGAARDCEPSINGDDRFRIKSKDSIVFVNIPSTRAQLMESIITDLRAAFDTIFEYDSEVDPRLKVTIHDDAMEQGTASTTETPESLTDQPLWSLVFETVPSSLPGHSNGGIIYAYRSPSLKDAFEVRHYTPQFGKLSTNNEFRVVPADRRRHIDGNMTDAPKLIALAGVLSSPLPSSTTDAHVYRGQQTMMQKIGTVGGFVNLTPGEKVYLGYNGHVTQQPQDIVFDEYVVEIGVARSETEIDVRIGDPRLKSTTRDTIPVGTIVPRAYDLSQTPPVAAPAPPGFLELEGQKYKAEEFPDLFYALTGESPNEHSPDLVLHHDPSHVIKAYSFNLFPDSASPELPTQARRYETPWQRISGDQIYSYNFDEEMAWDSRIRIPHNLRTSIRDIIGYVVVSVTDGSSEGSFEKPAVDAPQFILYPSMSTDAGNTFGFQFEEHSMNAIWANLVGSGLKIYHNGSLRDVETSTAEEIMAGATGWVAKFVIYRIENIYDFKDDRLMQKVNEFWYNHQRYDFNHDDQEIHRITASNKDTRDKNTLVRRDESGDTELHRLYLRTQPDEVSLEDVGYTRLQSTNSINENQTYTLNIDLRGGDRNLILKGNFEIDGNVEFEGEMKFTSLETGDPPREVVLSGDHTTLTEGVMVPTSLIIHTENGIAGEQDLSEDVTLSLTGQASVFHNHDEPGMLVLRPAEDLGDRLVSRTLIPEPSPIIGSDPGIIIEDGDGLAGDPRIQVNATVVRTYSNQEIEGNKEFKDRVILPATSSPASISNCIWID